MTDEARGDVVYVASPRRMSSQSHASPPLPGLTVNIVSTSLSYLAVTSSEFFSEEHRKYISSPRFRTRRNSWLDSGVHIHAICSRDLPGIISSCLWSHVLADKQTEPEKSIKDVVDLFTSDTLLFVVQTPELDNANGPVTQFLMHPLNAETDSVCDVQRARHVRGDPACPVPVSVGL